MPASKNKGYSYILLYLWKRWIIYQSSILITLIFGGLIDESMAKHLVRMIEN